MPASQVSIDMTETIAQIQERYGVNQPSNSTQLWVLERPESNWRLLNTITFSSQFKTVHVGRNEKLSDPAVQQRVARDLADGWRHNGPWPFATFRMITRDERKGVVEEMSA